MDFDAGTVAGWVGTAFGAIWIFYKEIYKKNQDAKLERNKAITEADIERQKHKDILNKDTQTTTLESYTKLNEKVFGLFESYLSDMKKEITEIRSDVTMIKNFSDMFDKQLDEISNLIIKIDTKLEASDIRRKKEEEK